MGAKGLRVEIMDTTLRDGEQTSGVSFVPHEKLQIAKKLLRDVGVDRIEVASARVSEGERKAITQICEWASSKGYLDRVEVLGFVDKHVSLDWIHSCGGQVINMLCKGSRRHCEFQLKKTIEQHLADIKNEIAYAKQLGIKVNIYLEDWSNGMKDSREYVYAFIDGLKDEAVSRFLLPDTLGVLTPRNTYEFLSEMQERYPRLQFDFHAHNDYGMAIGNVAAALRAGCRAIHTAVNGLGERAGNAPLASVQAVIKDHYGLQTHINERELYSVSRLVEGYSGIPIPSNEPVVGENVFTQVAGVHADGDSKDNLYCNALLPERFGRRREYALGKNSGKANILKNLENLGLELTPEETRRVTDRIVQLADKKEMVTADDLPYIVSDVLKHDPAEQKVKLLGYFVTNSYGLKPTASLSIEIDGQKYETYSSGDGQYDAFVRGLRNIYKEQLKRPFPRLTDYVVRIPPGGRTDAFVHTIITWEMDGKTLRTHALDPDQTEAAIKATIKMLNQISTNN
ncbi:MAG: 2-isopropylmalate synthase [Bacteroidaceae bacterium]|nr:2-isopropylmalate synthase [Bacteroidaceae bacterium]